MRIVLHIGMTKAGSSALQAGLGSLRKPLLKSGILYPDGGHGRRGHTLLVQGLVPPERLPRIFRTGRAGDPRALEGEKQRWINQLKRDIESSHPDTLILSEEFLFVIVDSDSLAELREQLCQLAASVDIEVLAYVRRPSEHYFSSMQQVLKASHRVIAPHPVTYRPNLEGYAEHVADQMRVAKYDPSTWPEGDILHDFLCRLDVSTSIVGAARSRRVNASLSAEASSLLAEYRNRIWPDCHNRFTADTDVLVTALQAADAAVGGSHMPHLHDNVRCTIDQGSVDLLWLRDVYGIVFEGVAYGSIAPAPRSQPVQCVEDVCSVDANRRAELTMHVLHQLASKRPARNVHEAMPRDGITVRHGGSITERVGVLLRRGLRHG